MVGPNALWPTQPKLWVGHGPSGPRCGATKLSNRCHPGLYANWNKHCKFALCSQYVVFHHTSLYVHRMWKWNSADPLTSLVLPSDHRCRLWGGSSGLWSWLRNTASRSDQTSCSWTTFDVRRRTRVLLSPNSAWYSLTWKSRSKVGCCFICSQTYRAPGARPWPSKVNWPYRSRDNSIRHMAFPVGGSLELSLLCELLYYIILLL